MDTTITHPAQLWIGQSDNLETQAIVYMQQLFCPAAACKLCIICKQIQEKTFHALLWLEPEKQYTLQTIEPLLHKLSFQADGRYYFILNKAHLLTAATANRLLKSIEEPPADYYFLLLAQNLESILPTIRSRCIVKSFHDNLHTIAHEQLIAYLTNPAQHLFAFHKEMEKTTISETDTLYIVERLLQIYSKECTEDSIKKISLLTRMLQKPPMPGSAKLFLKQLCMQLSS